MKHLPLFCSLIASLLGANLALADTFNVTSSACSGQGSFQAAVTSANANPGEDTVSLQVDVANIKDSSCGLEGADPALAYVSLVTDDLVLEGNGHTITGSSKWVDVDGATNRTGVCPSSDSRITIFSNPVGLIRLEDDVSVTINDLKLDKLRAIADMRSETSLTLNSVRADRTLDFYKNCDTPAIYLGSGDNQEVTINDSVFSEAWNDGFSSGSPDTNQKWFNSFISGKTDTATLSISGTFFSAFADIPVLDWAGVANIESSKFVDVGFLNIRGGTAKIVNSIFLGDDLSQDFYNRITASNNGSITLEASTVAVAGLECGSRCIRQTGGGAIIATTNATIELKASAVSVGFPDDKIAASVLLREASGGNITATAAPNPNWVQPVFKQDAAQLRVVLDQPALLTDAPGLPNVHSYRFSYEAVTPLLDDGGGTPGLLIDAVTDANTSNVLLSPIDGTTPITEDIFGNPRTEAGGTVRNIGAVQLGLAPTLSLNATGDMLVDLNWTRPLDPASGAISGYEVCFGTGTIPDPSTLGTNCEDGDGNPGTLETISNAPETLTGQVTGLNNGDAHWFLVRGVNSSGGGPWSNAVAGTPFGEIGTPDLTVTSTTCDSVLLEWTQPDMGGHEFAGYVVSWAVAGSGTVTGTIVIPDYDTLSTTITDLDCNAAYSFAVTASSVDGSSGSSGTIIAQTPPVPPVPTLGPVGLLLLTLLMLGVGTAGVRRRGTGPAD